MSNGLKENVKRLVIIGGGFAGVKLAVRLEKKLADEWEIYILSKTNFITYNPLLPEVVGASVLPGHVQAPIRQMVKRTRVRMVTVDKIDLEKRQVHYHNNERGQLSFDHLVLAAGVAANMSMIPGLQQYALPLKSVGDALYIRNQIVERLEQATIHPDPEKRRLLMSFVVVGGGFSGVETAGEIEDFLSSAVKYYKNISRSDCQIFLLHGTDCLLPELSVKLGKFVERDFRKRQMDVRLSAMASRIEENRVVLSDGEEIEAATIITTIGTAPHSFLQNTSLPMERGRIIVENDMSVRGIEGVWALGDCALVPNGVDGTYSPPTAQFADRQAIALANNIAAKLSDKETKAFEYSPAGMLASIGHNKAVAEIYGLRISGIVAFLMWRGIYLVKVPTLARKARLLLEWTWSLFFPPDIAHLGFLRTGECEEASEELIPPATAPETE